MIKRMARRDVLGHLDLDKGQSGLAEVTPLKRLQEKLAHELTR